MQRGKNQRKRSAGGVPRRVNQLRLMTRITAQARVTRLNTQALPLERTAPKIILRIPTG
jgi:hypothetical protein